MRPPFRAQTGWAGRTLWLRSRSVRKCDGRAKRRSPPTEDLDLSDLIKNDRSKIHQHGPSSRPRQPLPLRSPVNYITTSASPHCVRCRNLCSAPTTPQSSPPLICHHILWIGPAILVYNVDFAAAGGARHSIISYTIWLGRRDFQASCRRQINLISRQELR